MIIEELRDALSDVNGEMLLFDNPSFDGSIIGTSTDGAAVYEYTKMVEEYIRDEYGTTEPTLEQEIDTVDFIGYNVIRSLPYMASVGTVPIIVYPLDGIM